MNATTAPRNAAHLERFVYRAASILDAAAKNARTETEAAHAQAGRLLCVEMFGRLTARRQG